MIDHLNTSSSISNGYFSSSNFGVFTTKPNDAVHAVTALQVGWTSGFYVVYRLPRSVSYDSCVNRENEPSKLELLYFPFGLCLKPIGEKPLLYSCVSPQARKCSPANEQVDHIQQLAESRSRNT